MTEKPKPFTGEMWAYLLVNALRYLNDDQRDGLCYDLFVRSTAKTEIQDKINDFMEQEEETI